jgi:site-specific DNA-methyltransferase (adenine-specific)
MDYMATLPDKAFDLAIVDPPYGGGANAGVGGRFAKYDGLMGGGSDWETKAKSRFRGTFDKYKIERTGGSWSAKYGTKIKHWDIAPSQDYFNELSRVSKNQIIWGGNYFDLPPTRCFLIWRKLTISEKFSMAMVEYAWSSFRENAKWVEIAPQGTANNIRLHPTQKPIKLYGWILNNYAKPGQRILDTHLGSGSSAIAAHYFGVNFVGCELDKNYYDAAVNRFNLSTAQQDLFEMESKPIGSNKFPFDAPVSVTQNHKTSRMVNIELVEILNP